MEIPIGQDRIEQNKSDEKRVLNIYLTDGCFTLIIVSLSKGSIKSFKSQKINVFRRDRHIVTIKTVTSVHLCWIFSQQRSIFAKLTKSLYLIKVACFYRYFLNTDALLFTVASSMNKRRKLILLYPELSSNTVFWHIYFQTTFHLISNRNKNISFMNN